MDLKAMAVEVDQINETLSRVLDADQVAMLIDLLRESAREVEAEYRAVTGQDV